MPSRNDANAEVEDPTDELEGPESPVEPPLSSPEFAKPTPENPEQDHQSQADSGVVIRGPDWESEIDCTMTLFSPITPGTEECMLNYLADNKIHNREPVPPKVPETKAPERQAEVTSRPVSQEVRRPERPPTRRPQGPGAPLPPHTWSIPRGNNVMAIIRPAPVNARNANGEQPLMGGTGPDPGTLPGTSRRGCQVGPGPTGPTGLRYQNREWSGGQMSDRDRRMHFDGGDGNWRGRKPWYKKKRGRYEKPY